MGALGAGRRVRIDGDAVVFDGAARLFSAGAGCVEIAGGRIRWRVGLFALELGRLAQGIFLGAGVSVFSALFGGWMVHRSLPAGGIAGGLWAALSIVFD